MHGCFLQDEERRQKAKELLKRHRISPANSDIFTSPSTAKSKVRGCILEERSVMTMS